MPTLEIFELLPKLDQLEIVHSYGILLDKIRGCGAIINLFYLEGYFVEVHQDRQGSVVEIRSLYSDQYNQLYSNIIAEFQDEEEFE